MLTTRSGKRLALCGGSAMALAAALLACCRPVQAQDAASERRASLLILDFQDRTKSEQGLLSWEAADALAAALHDSATFRPLPTQQARGEVAARHMTQPFRHGEVRALARDMKADAVVMGEVLLYRVHEQQRMVHVLLTARLYTPEDEKPRFETRGVGQIAWGVDVTPHLQAETTRALDAAAAQMAADLNEVKAVVGIIYMAMAGKRVLLDIGREDGLVKGAVLSVYRRVYNRELGRMEMEYAGRVKVTEVDRDNATAKVLESKGAIATNDTVRGIVTPKQRAGRGH
ncbi:MAG: hypothetical protein ACE5R4_07510 [Armatimonadota bacterium]